MGTIAKVTAGGSTHLVASTAYATCPTAANTVAKVATIQDSQAFTLIDGVTVHIYFTYSNTAANPTLNVNSTGALPIYKYGTTVPGTAATTSWQAGSVVSFTYNKNGKSTGCWTMNDHLDDTNTQTVSGVKGNSESSYRTGNVNITAANVGAAASSHTHGNIQNNGTLQTTDITIANGDKIIVTDADSTTANQIARTSIAFDGSTATKCLTQKGTWESFTNNTDTHRPIQMNGTQILGSNTTPLNLRADTEITLTNPSSTGTIGISAFRNEIQQIDLAATSCSSGNFVRVGDKQYIEDMGSGRKFLLMAYVSFSTAAAGKIMEVTFDCDSDIGSYMIRPTTRGVAMDAGGGAWCFAYFDRNMSSTADYKYWVNVRQQSGSAKTTSTSFIWVISLRG